MRTEFDDYPVIEPILRGTVLADLIECILSWPEEDGIQSGTGNASIEDQSNQDEQVDLNEISAETIQDLLRTRH